MELLIELLITGLAVFFGELLSESKKRRAAEDTVSGVQENRGSWRAAVGFTLLGLCLGGASVLVVKQHMIVTGLSRGFNLLFTPVAVGYGVSRLGAWRQKKGLAVPSIEHFAYGYLFTLAFAAVRYRFAV